MICLVCLVNPIYKCGECGKWFCEDHILDIQETGLNDIVCHGQVCYDCENDLYKTYFMR